MWELNVMRSPDPTVLQASGTLMIAGTPYWPVAPDRYPGELPDRADVLVIGGGITGVSLMHHLAKAGIDAVLVERHHLAAGASGRNAGFLLAGVADCYAEAVRIFGRARTRDIWTMTVENHIEEIAAVAGQDIGYRRSGSVVLASGPKEAKHLAESAELMSEDGFQCSWDGSLLSNPGDGEVTPSLLVAAFARQCRAGCVILATNAYAPQHLPQVAIQPRRAQMLASGREAARLCDQPTY